jgi:hypothetical protein
MPVLGMQRAVARADWWLGVRFFVGLHQPHTARHFARCMVSVNVLWQRRSGFAVGDWMLDSGAFTELTTHGRYRHGVEVYAEQIRRWKDNGNLLCATTQDYMCEAFVLKITGKTVAEHQRLTIDRYDALVAQQTGVYILPVLQGYAPSQYVEHIAQYGNRLASGAWVGVGSVCKRNADVGAVERVLSAIKTARPDLRCHGFGLKTTALESSIVRGLLWSADSMAWSFAERKKEQARHRQGLPKLGPSRANDWRAAAEFVQDIESQRVVRRHGVQLELWS